MKRLIENVTSGYGPSARVVDGTLILSLPDAITPVVWRLDLGQTKASALEVRTDREDDDDGDEGKGGGGSGRFTLVLKTPKGEVHEIAPYDTRARAVQALMAVSYAMETAQGQMRPFSANDGRRAQVPAVIPGMAATGYEPKGGKALTALGAFALVVVLIVAILNIGPHRASLPMSDADLAAAGSPASQAAQVTGANGGAPVSGVPVSADQFLQKQQ